MVYYVNGQPVIIRTLDRGGDKLAPVIAAALEKAETLK